MNSLYLEFEIFKKYQLGLPSEIYPIRYHLVCDIKNINPIYFKYFQRSDIEDILAIINHDAV